MVCHVIKTGIATGLCYLLDALIKTLVSKNANYREYNANHREYNAIYREYNANYRKLLFMKKKNLRKFTFNLR